VKRVTGVVKLGLLANRGKGVTSMLDGGVELSDHADEGTGQDANRSPIVRSNDSVRFRFFSNSNSNSYNPI
jgi:hypothetical protein